ncbi:MAG: DUF89 family protein [Firmicutes bacterium]|nr:DUF89 family protein [Bacillota bacterium]
MRAFFECYPCLVRQAYDVTMKYCPDENSRVAVMKRIFGEIATAREWASTPELAGAIYRILGEAAGARDLFQNEKEYFNREMMKLEDDLGNVIARSADRFLTAVRLAAAGNIIDFGVLRHVDKETVMEAIRTAESKQIDRNALESLRSDLAGAGVLLYIGDNAGEIVFDKVLVSYIREEFPHLEVYFGTRGAPIVNDATPDDARLVGLDSLATIVSNGTALPGVVLSKCSQEFRAVFDSADVIISKGQGNFEALKGETRRNIYFLFTCKCDLITRTMGLKKLDLVLLREDRGGE